MSFDEVSVGVGVWHATDEAKKAELAERWRVAGQLLLRLAPKAFEALLAGAEVMVVMTPDPDKGAPDISLADSDR